MIKKLLNNLLVTGNIYSLLGNVIFAVFGFGSFLVLVRTINKETFGQWVLFITVASLFDMFRLGLTGTAAIRLISSNNKYKEEEVVAASYQLGTLFTIVLGVLSGILFLIIRNIFPESIYLPIFIYYPILAIANLPFNQALIWTQGKVNFKRFFILRFIGGGVSFIFITVYVFFIGTDLWGIIRTYIFSYAITSITIIVLTWDGAHYLWRNSRKALKEILKYGKYSTASYIGSNLLRSTDTLLLSLASFMGPEAIAIFAIPFKFVEVVEIPLRSFSATAFPRLSIALEENYRAFKKMLFNYTFWTTVILLPIAFILYLFPVFFLKLLGGNSFENSLVVQQGILNIICLYIIILPFDRFSGVALFAMNKPDRNFHKIVFMLIANIIFDMIAIFIFKSLIFVALATLIFTILGIVMGWFFVFQKQNESILTFIKRNISRIPQKLHQIKKWSYQ